MGIGPGYKSCYTNSSPSVVAPNPNPGNYRILRATAVGSAIVVEVHYVGCTNFEGNKIMVFENCSKEQFCKLSSLDPHFSETGISPVARFKPDALGWERAIAFARTL